MGWKDLFSRGLARTREALGRVLSAASGPGRGPEAERSLEEAFLGADLGPELAARLASAYVRGGARGRAEAADALLDCLPPAGRGPSGFLAAAPLARPEVTLLLGVNGSGKTTTAGKLAAAWTSRGQRVLLGAGDTFRAAAADQLGLWAARAGAELLRQSEGADPAAVAFDAVRRGVAAGFDRVLLDTAGRLQTKVNLMEELKKVHRVVGKALPGAPHRVLLVLDGTAGQNMASQARLFAAAVPLDGLVVTKLDGTARAGAVLKVSGDTGVPVALVGLGEGAGDLADFDPPAFIEALLPAAEGAA